MDTWPSCKELGSYFFYRKAIKNESLNLEGKKREIREKKQFE